MDQGTRQGVGERNAHGEACWEFVVVSEMPVCGLDVSIYFMLVLI